MARLLDGSGDYLQIASSADWNPTAFLVSCWLYIPSGHGNVEFDRVLECGGFTINSGWGLEFGPSGTSLKFIAWPSAAATVVGNAYTFSTNTWFHVGLRAEGVSTHRFYINGVQQGATGGDHAASAQALTIGGRNASPGNEQGEFRIAELAIFSADPGEGVVLGLAKGGSPRQFIDFGFGRKLRGYWPLGGRTSPEPELIQRSTATVTNATHFDSLPPIFGHAAPFITYRPAAGGGGGGGNTLKRIPRLPRHPVLPSVGWRR